MKTEEIEIDLLDGFYELSVVLTGFTRFELNGTGVGDTYFATAMDIVGRDIMTELIVRFYEILEASGGDESEFDRAFRREIINDDDKLGPVAGNLTKMWYLGNWVQLPAKWRQDYVTSSLDVTKVVSASAYREGLVWLALEAHPMGAKPMGFGTWGEKPGFWPETDHE
jgi:hypothetical protein